MKKRQFEAQSLVEFALILPIALFLILGFMDFGRAIFNYATLTNMVREGARYAIRDTSAVSSDYKNTIMHMNQYAFSIPKVDKDTISCATNDTTKNYECTFSDGGAEPRLSVKINRLWNKDGSYFEHVQVDAGFKFKPITPFIVDLIGDGNVIDLFAQSTMRLSGSAR